MVEIWPKFSLDPTQQTWPVIKIQPADAPALNYQTYYFIDTHSVISKTAPFYPNQGKVKIWINGPFIEETGKIHFTGDIYEGLAQDMPTLYSASGDFRRIYFWSELGNLWYDPNVVWRDNKIDGNYQDFEVYFGIGANNILLTIDLGQAYDIVKISSKAQAYLYNGRLICRVSGGTSGAVNLYDMTDYAGTGWCWGAVKTACWNGLVNARYLHVKEQLGASVAGTRVVRLFEWSWQVLI